MISEINNAFRFPFYLERVKNGNKWKTMRPLAAVVSNSNPFQFYDYLLPSA